MTFLDFFKKKKDSPEEGAASGAPAQEGGDNAVSEKQRQKKIKNMRSKFDETVWSSSLDVMKRDIPKFVITDGGDGNRYVLLGFDTKIVDDFSNKADNDIGSMMTAIKSSMDCVIEEGLLDNELIIMIPSKRTVDALSEFEDVFDMRFYVAYMNDNHDLDIESVNNDSSGYVSISLSEIREIIDGTVLVKDKIESLKAQAASGGPESAYDPDDITSGERGPDPEQGMSDTDGGDNDTDPDFDPDFDTDTDNDGEEPPEDDDGDPDDNSGEPVSNPETDDAKKPEHSMDEVRKAADSAAQVAARAAGQISDQKDDAVDAAKDGDTDNRGSSPAAAQNQNQQAAQPFPGAQQKEGKSSEVAAKIDKLKDAVQKASDEALGDEAIKNAQANINPQARVASFDMPAMDKYIQRRYYSDDLDLEITSQPFDAMFMQSNPYVPFVMSEDGSWLSAQMNNLRADANAKLEKLHYENVMLMRERYMIIIAKHCENITKSVSMDDPKSRFGYALKTINELKNDDLAKLSERAEAYKHECEAAYQARADVAAQNAAALARTQFENVHRAEHEREMKDIEIDLRNNIESEFIAAKENLKNDRRKEAKRQLDVGISETLKLCADEYTKMIALERQEYARLQKVITDFQNDSIAAEQARILTLAEEQRRSNEVTKVRGEYDSKFELAKREFESKLASVKAEMERSSLEHSNHIADIREQNEAMIASLKAAQVEQISHKDNEIETLKSQLDSVNGQLRAMTEKYVELDEKAGQKYASQIDVLKAERDAWTERSEQVERLHKYTDRIKLTAMIIAVIAALGLGTIFGCALIANTYNKNNANAGDNPQITRGIGDMNNARTAGDIGDDDNDTDEDKDADGAGNGENGDNRSQSGTEG